MRATWSLILIFVSLFSANSALALDSVFNTNSNSYQFNHITNELGSEVYAKFRVKLLQLQNTYILEKRGSRYSFWTYDNKTCAQETADKNMAFEVEYQKKYITQNNIKGTLHTITYKGCLGQSILIERIFTDNTTDTKDLTETEIFSLQRGFPIEDSENIKQHILIEPITNRHIVSLDARRLGHEKLFSVSVLSQKIITIQETSLPNNGTRVSLFRNTYDINFEKGRSRMGFSTDSKLEYSVLHTAKGIQFRKNSALNPISENSYIHVYSNYYVGQLNMLVGKILGLFLDEFPSSQIVQIQSANTKMLNELQEAYLRVTSKENLDLVAQLLLRYMEEVKNGNIQDNRPQ